MSDANKQGEYPDIEQVAVKNELVIPDEKKQEAPEMNKVETQHELPDKQNRTPVQNASNVMYLSTDFANLGQEKPLEDEKKEKQDPVDNIETFRHDFKYFMSIQKLVTFLISIIAATGFLLDIRNGLKWLSYALLAMDIIRFVIQFTIYKRKVGHDAVIVTITKVQMVYYFGEALVDLGLVLYFNNILTVIYPFAIINLILRVGILFGSDNTERVYSEILFERMTTGIVTLLILIKLGNEPGPYWLSYVIYFFIVIGFSSMISLFFLCAGMKQFCDGFSQPNISERKRSFKKLFGLALIFGSCMICSIMPNLFSLIEIGDAGLIAGGKFDQPISISLPNPKLHYIAIAVLGAFTALTTALLIIVKVFYDDELIVHAKAPKEEQSAGAKIITFAREMKLKCSVSGK